MASFVYDQAMTDILNQAINTSSDTFKWMLVTSTYSASKSDTAVSTASANEIVATNYTGGFAGASRLSAPRAISKDSTNHIVRVIFSGNATWSSIGAAPTTATIAAAVLIKEITNDAASKLIAYFGLTAPVGTNGSNFVLTVDSTLGNITFTL